jgi:hypothetical protein
MRGAGAAGMPPGGGPGFRPGIPGGGMGMMGGGFPGGMRGGGMGPGGFSGAGMVGGGFPGGMGMRGGGMPAGFTGGGMGMMGGGQRPGMGMGGGFGFSGGGGGFLGGLAGFGMGNGPDVDDNPYFIVAVVEVEATTTIDPSRRLDRGLPITVRHKWGTTQLRVQTPISKTVLLKEHNGKPLPAVYRRFQAEKDKVFKGTPTPAAVLELAEWCLEHGQVDRFVEVMDKLVELDKNNPVAAAYAKVRDELKRPVEKGDPAAGWRSRLLEGYKLEEPEGSHYAVLHNMATVGDSSIKSMMKTLENTFRGFYYWWALRGVVLPVPREQQVAVITTEPKDFKHFHDRLPGPVVSDGYFARREGVTVLSARRLDEPYEVLEKFSNAWWQRGFQRESILLGQRKVGYPANATPDDIANAQMLALLLKAMEHESELTSVTHDASRQMLYAAGLLPRNVAAPEWVLFGMGSFFETSPQSPWPTIGAPSFYWLPRFKEMKKGEEKGLRLEKTPADTLQKVVTDAYFRQWPRKGEQGSLIRRAHDDALRRARTTAWSLTYFLAKEKLSGLQLYFKELSKLPRDMELDEGTLLETFAQAFGAVDVSNKPDRKKLSELANQWYNYIENVSLESEELRTQITKYYKEMQLLERLQQNQGQPAGNQPGAPPGGNRAPGGGNRPGSGA